MLRVKELREKRRMTQQQLAEASGLSLRSISYIEAGATDPKTSTLRRLAAALDVPLKALFGEAA